MNCPECNELMNQGTIGENKINECPRCRGLWLEHDELDGVKAEVMTDMGWLDIDAWKKQAEFKVRHHPHFCPNCRDVALTTIEDQKSATEISICIQCKGTWLGTGQFLNLINALLDEAYQKSAPELIKISLRQAKEMLTSPEEAIAEWQDLKDVLALLKHRIFIDHPKLRKLIVGVQKSMPL